MPDDDSALASYATQLAAAVEAALGAWVVRTVTDRAPAYEADAMAAADRCVAETMPRLRELLATDIDRQRTTPLAILRSCVTYPTEVLVSAGVPVIRRDALDSARDPDDIYSAAVATWADLGAEVASAGISWGAAKAHVHLARRRAQGPGGGPS